MWAAANDMYAHNDELTFSDKLTKIAGAHGLKFGASVSRLQKQQNFQNDEEMQLIFAPGWSSGSTGNAVGDILTGRVPRSSSRARKSPDGEYRFWNIDFFAQDSWKVRPNFTLEFGVRAGYWPNNEELNGLGGCFDPSIYDPNRGAVPGSPALHAPERRPLHRRRSGAPTGILPTAARSRCRASTSRGTSTARATTSLRGGYGMFYNRNMGNVEYDNTLRLPPYIYRVGHGRRTAASTTAAASA